MSVADVETTIQEVVETTERFPLLLKSHKTAVRYAMVDPILRSLDSATQSPAECRPDFELGQRGKVDYALFDQDGDIAVFIGVGVTYARWRSDRQRLAGQLRGINGGLAVLIYGWCWEIYDLSMPTRRLEDRLVENLSLDADETGHVAQALYAWFGRDQWWPATGDQGASSTI